MPKKNIDARPFYGVSHEYQTSLKEYTAAAVMLHAAVCTALHLFSDGVDSAKALESLRKPAERFHDAAFGKDKSRDS